MRAGVLHNFGATLNLQEGSCRHTENEAPQFYNLKQLLVNMRSAIRVTIPFLTLQINNLQNKIIHQLIFKIVINKTLAIFTANQK